MEFRQGMNHENPKKSDLRCRQPSPRASRQCKTPACPFRSKGGEFPGADPGCWRRCSSPGVSNPCNSCSDTPSPEPRTSSLDALTIIPRLFILFRNPPQITDHPLIALTQESLADSLILPPCGIIVHATTVAVGTVVKNDAAVIPVFHLASPASPPPPECKAYSAKGGTHHLHRPCFDGHP